MLLIDNAFLTPASYDDATQTQTGGVYTSTGRLVEVALRPHMGAWKHVDPPSLDQAARSGAAVELDQAVYGGRYFAHFGHFLLETAPALHAAASLAETIVCHPNPAGWRQPWAAAGFRGYLLKALGIAEQRIHLVETPTRVAHLTVPAQEKPPITGVVGPVYVATCSRIRDYALAEGTAKRGGVYLSRRQFVGGSNRSVENEAELEALFEKRGFSIVVPEKLPMSDQIRAVADADWVAGIDGSALHLCAFMRPGAKVLIIETRPFPTQRAINKAIGLSTFGCSAPLLRKEGKVSVYRADIQAISKILDSTNPSSADRGTAVVSASATPTSSTQIAPAHMSAGAPRYLWSDNLSADTLKEDGGLDVIGGIQVHAFSDVELRSDYMLYQEGTTPILGFDLYPDYVKRWYDEGHIKRFGFPTTEYYWTEHEPAFVVSNFNMATYGHFLLEVLPKLLLAKALRRAGNAAKIAFPGDVAWATQIVKTICEPSELVTYESKKEMLRLRAALLPTRLTSARSNLHQLFSTLVRAFALETGIKLAKSGPRPRRLFLSRQKHPRSFRRLTNESDLFDVAKDYGFHLVHPQELPWLEQVALFDGATHIIGEYTSALHNHLFSPAGTRIVALGRLNRVVSAVGAALGHEVGFLLPKGGTQIQFRPGWTEEQNFEIDPVELRRRLDGVMIAG